MTDKREELIEEAAKAMHDAYEAAAIREGWETQERSRKPWSEVPDANRRTMLVAVEAALAVFEQAHTPMRTVIQITPEAVQREYELRNGVPPTDDERDTLTRALADGERESRRTGGSARTLFAEQAKAILAAGFRRTVQGEPTDALAKLDEAWFAEWEKQQALGDRFGGYHAGFAAALSHCRAALRAARAAEQEGQER